MVSSNVTSGPGPREKWTLADSLVVLAQIVVPLTAIGVALFAQTKTGPLSPDVRLSIIGLGLVVPVVLTQVSLTREIKSQGTDVASKIELARTSLVAVDEKLSHISPVLEQVFLSDNDRMKRFAFRRLEEAYKVVGHAVNTMTSGQLRTNEYYEELLYLGGLIMSDTQSNGSRSYQGEIWAMTSFAEDEWTKDDGYEALWTVELRKMLDLGIPTRRLCILPTAVRQLVTAPNFAEPAATDCPSFFGFLALLEDYYGPNRSNHSVRHSVIKPSDSSFLTGIRGFFGIKLASGELHILYGETVDFAGALTAEVLFDPTGIANVQRVFNNFMNAPQLSLEAFVNIQTSDSFREYLARRGVNVPRAI